MLAHVDGPAHADDRAVLPAVNTDPARLDDHYRPII
jgi:hypothetical protein